MTEYNKISFDVIVDFGKLYQSYTKTKKSKKPRSNELQFRILALDGLLQLKINLLNKTYTIAPYNVFKVFEPKERVIMSSEFRDKIVQHSLCDNYLLPKFKTEFILDNYAGQKNKGTLFGLNRLQQQMLEAYNEYGMNCWILKADISKFFYSIDHDILKDILKYFVDDENIYWLCDLIIDSTDGTGLPLGNQSSQVFALLFLSRLDKFIVGELGIKYYGRYMDDFYIIFPSKEYLKWCLECITYYIETLKLSLNNKTQIVPFKNGIKFCGFHTYVTDEGKVIRKLDNKNKRAAKKKYLKMAKNIEKKRITEKDLLESYYSWRNHISHGNCIKLTYEMDQFIKQLLEKYGCRKEYRIE